MKLTDENIKSILKVLSTRELFEKVSTSKAIITNKQINRLTQKKLSDKDIISLLKVLSASELLERHVRFEINLSSEQLTKIIEIKNGERENYDD